jgi:gluconate 5-dehydrogenase
MHDNRVVIVTGSGGGIGRWVAKTFAQERAKVVVADIKPLDTVSRELQELGIESLAVPTDVRDEVAVRNLVDRTVERFGRVDVLVNVAAIVTHFQWGLPRWPRVRDMDLEFWNKVVDTNLGGTMLCMKHVIPHLERQGGGHIVNTLGGSQPETIGAMAYVTTKEAVRHLTRFVAEEERDHNICVVATGPGAQIATEDAPAEARGRMPGPEAAGNRFVMAATAPMAMSGQTVTVQDGKLTVQERYASW